MSKTENRTIAWCDLGADHDVSPDYQEDWLDKGMEDGARETPQEYTRCSLGFLHFADIGEDFCTRCVRLVNNGIWTDEGWLCAACREVPRARGGR